MQLKEALHSANRKQRYLVAFIIVAAVALAGVLFVLRKPLYSPGVTRQAPPGQSTIITEIVLGTPASKEQAASKTPLIKQTNELSTADGLMMQITTAREVREPVQVRVRLLSKEGRIVEIDPPSVVFAPGTTSFCCWQITTPGQYTMQVFRPEGGITSIPLTIREAPQQPSDINAGL